MLLEAAAALLTSVALGTVTGAVVAPAHPQVVDSRPVSTVGAAPPQPVIGPDSGASLNAVEGGQLLTLMSTLSSSTLTRVLSDPANVDRIVTAPPVAAAVAPWWNTLDASRQSSVLEIAPQLVGNLDGVPMSVRDVANRAVLNSAIDTLRGERHDVVSSTVRAQSTQRLAMLESIDVALAAGPQRFLLSLDARDQGRAAIVVGDLERADYVSVLVPGMFFTIQNQMGYWTDAAARLRDEQLAWLDRLEGTAHGLTVATIAWIGYPTPDLTNVAGVENAYEGRDALAGLLSGVRAARGTQQPHVSVVAHSYGSTAAIMTLQEFDVEVDALALVGSPGSSARSVDELRVRDHRVYVGEAAWDPVTNSSFFGADPGAKSYGATRMNVSGSTDIITGDWLAGSVGHNEYFTAGTESLRNFAVIGIGRGDLVTTGKHLARGLAR